MSTHLPEPAVTAVTDSAWRRRAYAGAVALCLLMGLALRVFGAWATRAVTDPDAGVVALMVHHMAAGLEFPIFFYGQPYMGTLEPAVSAWLCAWFGTSGFMLNLGPALLGVLALPVLFGWARDAGGRAAALAALALCVVGPATFFIFQFNPRGGYMATLLLGLLVMWLAGRMAQDLWQHRRVPLVQYLLLGLLAGLGWWTHALIVSALATAAVVLLIGARGRVPLAGVAAGLAAFAVGSAPFWWWNATHHWQSFEMAHSFGTTAWYRGARLLALRYQRLLNLPPWPAPWRALAAALPLVLAGAGALWAAWRVVRPRAAGGFNPHRLSALLFLALSAVLFVRSSYSGMNTARYLLPWVAPAALLAGLAVARLYAHGGLVLATLPVALILVTQVPVLRDMRTAARLLPAQRRLDADLSETFREHGVTAAYGHFMHYVLNFRLEERVAVTGLTYERYPPIARAAELSDRIALLDNTGRFSDFLVVGGGTAQTLVVDGLQVDLDLQAPVGGRTEIPPAEWREVHDAAGADLRALVADRHADTAWQETLDVDHGAHVEVQFHAPQTLRMVRLLAPGAGTYPRRLGIEILRPGAEAWEEYDAPRVVTRYFWSGPRLYNNGPRFRLEYRFPDVPVQGVRFVAPPAEHAQTWAVSELQLFAPGPELPPETQALPDLLAHLRSTGIQRLYCDRWAANRVHAALDGTVDVVLEPLAFPDGPVPADAPLRLDPHTALLAPAPDAPLTREVLARHGVTLDETVIGPWVLFAVRPGAEAGRALFPALQWTGYGCLAGRHRTHALVLVARAHELRAAGAPPEDVRDLLAVAASNYPPVFACMGNLLEWLEQTLPDPQTDALVRQHAQLMHPPLEVNARFDGAIDFLGLTPPAARAAPGDTLEFTYYWRAPSEHHPHPWAVFIHLSHGRWRFQDDHNLPRIEPPIGAEPPYCAEVIQIRRTVRIPDDAPPGPYDLRIGLYDRSGSRARVTGYGHIRRHAVILPGLFTVAPDADPPGAKSH